MSDFGKIAYEGYCKNSGCKSLISGADLPAWDDLSESIRAAWRSAADAVLDAS